jgi:hypothetical protein
MSGYRQVRAMMNSRSKFDFDRVCAFVMTSDSFMERYVALTGREGMTNYFHMLRDGHIAYYLERYNNLYRLSLSTFKLLKGMLVVIESEY